MKLIYIDPQCSGLQVADCKDKKSIKKVLKAAGMDYGTDDGIYYVFVDADGNLTMGREDFL